MKSPIDILDKTLGEIRFSISQEMSCIEEHETQVYEAKLRLQELQASKTEYENIIMQLKGKQ